MIATGMRGASTGFEKSSFFAFLFELFNIAARCAGACFLARSDGACSTAMMARAHGRLGRAPHVVLSSSTSRLRAASSRACTWSAATAIVW